jgi:hypothetical protein
MNEVSLRELASVGGGCECCWCRFWDGFVAGFYAACGF